MAISDIKRGWVRKPLVALVAPIWWAGCVLLDILTGVERYLREGAARDWRTVQDAWRGTNGL